MSARPPSVPHPNRALRDTSAVDPLEEIDGTVGGRTCIVLLPAVHGEGVNQHLQDSVDGLKCCMADRGVAHLAIPRLEPSEDDDDLTLVRREAAILSGLRIT